LKILEDLFNAGVAEYLWLKTANVDYIVDTLIFIIEILHKLMVVSLNSEHFRIGDIVYNPITETLLEYLTIDK
jgi:hypothetical protein